VDTYSPWERKESTMAKRRRSYPLEFRQQLVDLVRAGRSPEELAKEFGPSGQAIRNWAKQADLDAGKRKDGLTSEEQEELKRLRRENKQLRIEREILAKAAAWFARETDAVPPKSSPS
jgi:transposase